MAYIGSERRQQDLREKAVYPLNQELESHVLWPTTRSPKRDGWKNGLEKV